MVRKLDDCASDVHAARVVPCTYLEQLVLDVIVDQIRCLPLLAMVKALVGYSQRLLGVREGPFQEATALGQVTRFRYGLVQLGVQLVTPEGDVPDPLSETPANFSLTHPSQLVRFPSKTKFHLPVFLTNKAIQCFLAPYWPTAFFRKAPLVEVLAKEATPIRVL